MNNKIEIFGRVTKEPEISTYPCKEGESRYVLRWSLAQYQGKDDTVFWYCSMFGDLEYLQKQINKLPKGRRVFVEGPLFVKKRTIVGLNGAETIVPVNNVHVREITYADGKLGEEDTAESGTSTENSEQYREKQTTKDDLSVQVPDGFRSTDDDGIYADDEGGYA